MTRGRRYNLKESRKKWKKLNDMEMSQIKKVELMLHTKRYKRYSPSCAGSIPLRSTYLSS